MIGQVIAGVFLEAGKLGQCHSGGGQAGSNPACVTLGELYNSYGV